MIPLVDVTPLQDGNRFRGIGTYVRGLLTGLEESGIAYRRVGLPPPAPPVDMDTAMRIRGGSVAVARRSQRHVPIEAGEFAHLTSLEAADTRVAGPFLATLHDPIPLLFPQWHFRGRGGLRRRRRYQRYLQRLRGAQHLVAVSRATAEAFARILDRPLDDFTVTPLAPAALPPPSGWQWRDGAPYVFVAGNHERHKNLAFAVDVAAALPVSVRTPLVITGVRDESSWQRLEDRASALGVELAHEGHVDQQRLADLYAGARVMLMPSLFEGFGLPTLEAMACGTPVVVSDRGALPEVVGDAGTVLALDVAEWAGHVAQLLQSDRPDPDVLRAYAARFSWRRTAMATLAAYERMSAPT